MLVLDEFKVAYLHINKTAGTSLRAYLTDLAGGKVNQMGPTHGPLSAYERLLGGRFTDYKILVSIRNPLARLYSIYLFRKSRYLSGDISTTTEAAFLYTIKNWFTKVMRPSQRPTDFSISNSVLIDGVLPPNVHIVAVETLGKDMNRFCREFMGIKNPRKLPFLNKTNYGKDHYTKYYDDHFKELVYNWDKWIIDNYYAWIM